MRGRGIPRVLLFVMALALANSSAVLAQLNASGPSVNLNAVINPRLAVAVSPGTVNFQLFPGGGVSRGDNPLTITTAWNLRAGTNNVSLFGYFSSAAAALTNGGSANIPSSRVRGSVNGGPFIAFTQNSPFGAGRSLRIFRQPIRRANRIGQRNDTLNLQINTVGLLLPFGTYTGVLHIQARAI